MLNRAQLGEAGFEAGSPESWCSRTFVKRHAVRVFAGGGRREIHPNGGRATIAGTLTVGWASKERVHFRIFLSSSGRCGRHRKSQKKLRPGETFDFLMLDHLSADVHGAEAENHVAAGRGTAKAQIGLKREKSSI